MIFDSLKSAKVAVGSAEKVTSNSHEMSLMLNLMTITPTTNMLGRTCYKMPTTVI